MRIERWYWLFAFVAVSLCIHAGMLYKSRTFGSVGFDKPGMMEVTLLPSEPTVVTPQEKQPEPPKVAQVEPEPEPIKQEPLPPKAKEEPIPLADIAPPAEYRKTVRLPVPEDPEQQDIPLVSPEERLPVQPNAEPGGVEPDKEKIPVQLGAPNSPRTDEPMRTRLPKVTLPQVAGGSNAPSVVLGGTGGAKAPDAPPEDVVYNRGGAGGENLPKETARMGGGGGKSILSVENPLAKEAQPDDRPGLGPGRGGGEGTGRDGGVGFAVGRGVGVNPNGKVALGTLGKTKPGIGLGAGKGDGIGTNPPPGKGTGSELPGTGGEGTGYGRGNGIGIGDGETRGIVGISRGIPFGSASGLLKGDPDGGGGKDGGPGGPGRGALFGARPVSSKGGRMAIVYTMDISGSMERGNKIGKAKEALKQALSELKRTDTFNIVFFASYPTAMSTKMLNASTENVTAAMNFIDEIRMRDGTNVSAAMEMALSFGKISHVFLMSDGEPHGGITEPIQLRAFIKEKNTENATVLTLALGLSDNSSGFELLKSIAADNNGKYSYINLARQ
jgi:uncharacterized protein YegL